MDFKKKLEKKIKDTSLVQQHRKQASKSVFLFSAFVFFSNIFIIWSDKNNNLGLFKFLLPFSYAFFLAAMCFLIICSIDNLLPEKFQSYKKILYWLTIALFILPLLVFFIPGGSIATNLN
jgi:apolipoprotein N-acyltransferase